MMRIKFMALPAAALFPFVSAGISQAEEHLSSRYCRSPFAKPRRRNQPVARFAPAMARRLGPGLRARGAFELDIAWCNGKLVEAAIRSLNGGSTQLRYGSVTRSVKLNKGETYRWNGQ